MAVLLAPVVLTIGTFVLIPLALVLGPVLLVFGIAVLAGLAVSAVAAGTMPEAAEPTIPAARSQPPVSGAMATR